MSPTTVIAAERDHGLRTEHARSVIADAGSFLAASLDFEETLAGIAELAVRSLADCCVIDIVDGGEIKRLRVAHADPARAELTQRLLRFPLDRRRPHLSLTALETGSPVLIPGVSDATLETLAQGPEHLAILRELQPRSFMAVPMIVRGRQLGVVLFVSSNCDYDEADLGLAEKLVQLAGLELDNARLYREARTALQARDRVLGVVAHDLRNPLNVITLSGQLLLEAAFPESKRPAQVQLILKSAKRMDRLIQDLLDVSRIEADRLFLLPQLEVPSRLAREAVELNSPVAAARSLMIVYTSEHELPPVMADRERVLQVLSNLIGNSIKFTPPGGRIEVRVEPTGNAVRFAVCDTGPGIRPEELPRIFEPFWQARKGTIEGAGLGLMIARGIVEAHGGRIWVESQVGCGSTFYFTLPTGPPPAADDRRAGVPDRRGTLPGSP